MKKKNKFLVILFSVMAITSLSGCVGETGDKGPVGDKGPQGVKGENGTDGNKWIHGNGTPNESIGSEGDIYLDIDNGDVYRKDGSWKKVTNIHGENGANGENGKDGEDGENGSSGTNGKTAWSNTILPTYGGVVIPSKSSVFVGETISFSIIPYGSNLLDYLKINNKEVGFEDSKLQVGENNTYTYTTVMEVNGFVVEAKFKDEFGNPLTPPEETVEPTPSIGFEASAYTFNETYNLEKTSPFYQFTVEDLENYYANVNFEESGEIIMSSLYELLKSDHKMLDYSGAGHSYNVIGKGSAYALADRNFDTDPLTKEEAESSTWKTLNVKTNILYQNEDFIFNENFNAGANREHIWPKSHGFSNYEEVYPGTDLHHIRLSEAGYNSEHSNKFYGDETTVANWCPPTNEDKGDLARAIFYMGTRYSQYDTNSAHLVIKENPIDRNCESTSTNGNPAEFGILSTLLKWHEEDPVSQFELARNNFVYHLQGNRNPFIDCPDLVDIIYG